MFAHVPQVPVAGIVMAERIPRDVTCAECGTIFQSTGPTAKYCPDCRKVRIRAAGRAYYHRRMEEEPEAFKKRIKEIAEKYYENNKDAVRERVRAWREKNREFCREYNRQWRENNRERVRETGRASYYRTRPMRAERDNARARLQRKKKKDPGAYMELAAMTNTLKECPRLHIKSLNLPCGERVECFGAQRCQFCPADASPPNEVWNKSWGWRGGSKAGLDTYDAEFDY